MNKFEQVAEILRRAKEDIAAINDTHIYRVSMDCIHVDFKVLSSMYELEEFEVKQRPSLEYPIEISVNMQGIKIMAIASETDYRSAFPDLMTPQEIEIETLKAKIKQLEESK